MSERRRPLSRERVLAAAVEVADTDGVTGVTMRAVGDRLGVEAMALYRHVPGKDGLLDGLVAVVVEEVVAAAADLPATAGDDWRAALRKRVLRARTVMQRHPWAPALVMSRGDLGPGVMRWFEDLTAVLFDAGFDADLVHHALHALGSRALGFSPELFAVDSPAGSMDEEEAMAAVAAVAAAMPGIARVLEAMSHDAGSTLGMCDDDTEFRFGLDALLDGLEVRRAGGWQPPPRSAAVKAPPG